MKPIYLLLLVAFFLGGCAAKPVREERPTRMSPTQALVRGEIAPDEYLDAIKQANEQDRAKEQFELNKEPTRAYNTKTGRIEYVPEGTVQSWNEQNQRWEFTPVN
jgi:hypothetical protein